MAEVMLKENGPASFMAGGQRFLPETWTEVNRGLAERLKDETNSKGKKIFKVRDLEPEETPEDNEQNQAPEKETKQTEEGSEEEGTPEEDETPLEETDRFKELDEANTVPELKEMADKFDLDYNARVRKDDLIVMIMEAEVKMIEEGKEEESEE